MFVKKFESSINVKGEFLLTSSCQGTTTSKPCEDIRNCMAYIQENQSPVMSFQIYIMEKKDDRQFCKIVIHYVNDKGDELLVEYYGTLVGYLSYDDNQWKYLSDV